MSLDLATAPPWLRALVDAGEHLPEALREAIVAQGAAALPALVAILEDDALAADDAPGAGWAPIQAARLLLALRHADALAPLLRALAACEPEAILYSAIVCGLPAWGAQAFPGVIEAFEQTRDPDYRTALLDVLASLGVRDDRIYHALLAKLDEEPELGAVLLGGYGDPRALPALERAFVDHPPGASEEWPYGSTQIEVADAIERLGGMLSPAMEAALAEIRATRRTEYASAPRGVRREGPKVGRNDRCPCGSGRKFKKCHGA